MRSIFKWSVIIAAGCFWGATVGFAQESNAVTLEKLLDEMINRDAIARYPDPYYTTRQFSSYDRKSVEPGDSTWFANWDRTMFIREEENKGGTEYVMLDIDKPGAIVRFWMTFAGDDSGQGTLRIYFDGEEEPTIEGTAVDILSGGALVGAPLSTSVSKKSDYEIRGHNLYLPLPYKSSCKITYESDHIEDPGAKSGGESVYYNINYREYEVGTQVRTFSHSQLDETSVFLEEVQQQLIESPDFSHSKVDTENDPFSGTIEPGDSLSFSLNGAQAIRGLAAEVEAKNTEQALRSTIMKISFDGTPTVWAPVGDFFGTGYQYREFDTWYASTTNMNLLEAYWVMPFQESAEITLLNLGDQKIDVSNTSIAYSQWDWDNNSMYFGASWRQYSDLYTGERKDMDGAGNPFDLNYVELQGQGVYVGDVLTLFNTTYAWWGEGDEKIYIDGEDFPSHFGTGTEDYYGYAWVRPEVFNEHPFISQPDGSGNITPGYTVNSRFRSLDGIPFEQSLTVDMEMWHWVSAIIDFAPTTFYYLKPRGYTAVEPDAENARRQVTLKREDLISPKITDGRLEGENLIIDEFTDGAITYQYLDEPKLSNNIKLWWREAGPENRLTARFVAGQQQVVTPTANLFTSSDFGKVRILINGTVVLEEFNGYSESASTKEVQLNNVELKEGENRFEVEIIGKDTSADKAFFGLDYIDF